MYPIQMYQVMQVLRTVMFQVLPNSVRDKVLSLLILGRSISISIVLLWILWI